MLPSVCGAHYFSREFTVITFDTASLRLQPSFLQCQLKLVLMMALKPFDVFLWWIFTDIKSYVRKKRRRSYSFAAHQPTYTNTPNTRSKEPRWQFVVLVILHNWKVTTIQRNRQHIPQIYFIKDCMLLDSHINHLDLL